MRSRSIAFLLLGTMFGVLVSVVFEPDVTLAEQDEQLDARPPVRVKFDQPVNAVARVEHPTYEYSLVSLRARVSHARGAGEAQQELVRQLNAQASDGWEPLGELVIRTKQQNPGGRGDFVADFNNSSTVIMRRAKYK